MKGTNSQINIDLALEALKNAKATDSILDTVTHINTALLDIGAALSCLGITEGYARDYPTGREMIALRYLAER